MCGAEVNKALVDALQAVRKAGLVLITDEPFEFRLLFTPVRDGMVRAGAAARRELGM
jgi:hypothetical protein